MGHRANFVLVDDAGWRLYYSHWAANRFAAELIAGPEAMIRFVSAQRPCDREGEWLDDIWAEGGAVVDPTRRRLVFYGGTDDLDYDLAVKRAFMRVLTSTWPGWTVEWAYDGIGDLAAYVGVDRAVVRAGDEEERELPAEVYRSPYPDDACHLITVLDAEGGLTAYPLSEYAHAGWHGPELLERLPAGGVTRLELTAMPVSGLHVDARTRTAGAWLTGTSAGLVPALPQLWPGWDVRFWEDLFEEQTRRCAGAVSVPPLDLPARLDWLTSLAKRPGEDPVPAMLQLIEDIHSADDPGSADGQRPSSTGDGNADGGVRLNPLFTAHAQVNPTASERSAALEAIDALRAELAEGRPG